MGAGRAARHAEQGAAGERIPVRCPQAGVGWHQIDAAVVGHRGGQCFDLAGAGDQAEAVAQREAERQAEYERQVRDARAMRASEEFAVKNVDLVNGEVASIDEGRWLRRVLRVFRVRDKVT